MKAIKDLNYNKKIEGQTPVSDFKHINTNPTENIYVMTDKTAQKNMDKFLELRNQIKLSTSKIEKNEIWIEIEKIKHKLQPYQISVYPNYLIDYRDQLQPEEEILNNKDYPYKFIPFEIQKEYAYDEKLGFLKEPKKQMSNLTLLWSLLWYQYR